MEMGWRPTGRGSKCGRIPRVGAGGHGIRGRNLGSSARNAHRNRTPRRSPSGALVAGWPISRVLSGADGRFTARPSSHPLAPGRSSVWAPRRRGAHAAYPELDGDEPPPAPKGFAPAWPCSRWGLPGRRHCCRRRWSLTPPFHPCRRERRRSVSVALSPGFPVRELPGTPLGGARTFLEGRALRDRPANLPSVGMIPAGAGDVNWLLAKAANRRQVDFIGPAGRAAPTQR